MKSNKSYIAIACSLIMILFYLIFGFSTKAASVTWDKSIKTGYYYSTVNSINILRVNKKDTFCVEWDKSVDTTNGYSKQSYTKQFTKSQWNELIRIAHVGYNKKKHTKADFAATQVYLWQTLRSYDGYTPWFGGKTNIPDFTKRINDIKANIALEKELESKKVSFHGTTIKMKPNSSIKLYDKNGLIYKGKFAVDTLPKGISAKISGNSVILTASSNASSGTATLKIPDINQTSENVLFYHPSSQNVSQLGYIKANSTYVTIQMEKYGEIEITKQDDMGNFVPDTSFLISRYADMKNPVGTYTTKSDGKIRIPNLTAGTYYIQECKVNENLVLDTKIYKVSVTAGKITSHHAVNKVKKASLQLHKKSSFPSISDNNVMYSLKGAVYGVYDDETCTHKVQELICDEKGVSNIVSLSKGIYYIKEIKAPQGYALNEDIRMVELSNYEPYVVEDGICNDVPKRNPIDVLIKKTDYESLHPCLEDAIFEVCYYDQQFSNINDCKGNAKRVWRIKTDQNGYSKMDPAYLISGDPFYMDENKQIILPIGTITIKEIQPPKGYQVNETVFIKQIKDDSTKATLNQFQEPIEVIEKPITLSVVKKQKDSQQSIANVTFKHTLPDGTTMEYRSNEEGEFRLEQLSVGIHTLEEVKTIDGYKPFTKPIIFEVGKDNRILLHDENNLVTLTKDSNLQYILTIFNELTPLEIEIVKINNHQVLLNGAVFAIYEDQECSKQVDSKTSTDGHITFDHLNYAKTYYIREEKAPAGYKLPFNPHVYAITAKANPAIKQFEVEVDQKKYTPKTNSEKVSVRQTPKCHQVTLTVINEALEPLPQTGSSTMFVFVIIGVGCMFLSIHQRLKIKE